jgi:ribonuclease Z
MTGPSQRTLELTFLGAGNAFAGDRYWSSFILNRRYLFDAPPTVLPHLNKLGISTLGIAAVFISHFHADHFFGLPFLYLDYEYLTNRTNDLVIVTPPRGETIIEQLSQLGFAGLTRSRRYRRVYQEAGDGVDGNAAGLPYRAIAVEQSGSRSLDCFGYRVELEGRTLAYTGDTIMCEGVRELARDADVLVIDCTCWHDPCEHHMSLGEVRRFRKEVSPETTFVLTHLDAGKAPTIDLPGMIIAEDFRSIRL